MNWLKYWNIQSGEINHLNLQSIRTSKTKKEIQLTLTLEIEAQKRSGANIAFISESLAYTDQKTTENHLASFEQEERIKNAAFLTKFLYGYNYSFPEIS